MTWAMPQTNPDPIEDPIERSIRAGAFRDAIALCARMHGAPLGRLCMAMLGSQAEAEECVQEVLLAAHDAFPSYRGEGTVRAFLFGIARRMCARRLEMRGRRERRLRLVHDADAPSSDPEGLLEARREAEKVRDALERLKPSERDAVVMRYQGGLEYREIAAACGIDEPAARKRVSRGLARMKELLSEVER
ncbi:RNA polymerase sigma-70 factor, ECF subfamily [Sandaracinus amylolyticus]|uniref:RNA polymerase sigma-70 factor, ECF subfamily n=2 Tax=Sandaracinus amylolyticus TaxID=927083 RepID=A0A0F6YNK1_9BACT|nr:RNA polymerase sigma-70 factor, ECF subfamily [Sandaracinus amylolyticus]